MALIPARWCVLFSWRVWCLCQGLLLMRCDRDNASRELLGNQISTALVAVRQFTWEQLVVDRHEDLFVSRSTGGQAAESSPQHVVMARIGMRLSEQRRVLELEHRRGDGPLHAVPESIYLTEGVVDEAGEEDGDGALVVELVEGLDAAPRLDRVTLSGCEEAPKRKRPSVRGTQTLHLSYT